MPFALENNYCFTMEDGNAVLLESDYIIASNGRWSLMLMEIPPSICYPPVAPLFPSVNEIGFTFFIATRQTVQPPIWLQITTPSGSEWAIPDGLCYTDGTGMKEQMLLLYGYTLCIYTNGPALFSESGIYKLQLVGLPDVATVTVVG